LSLLRLDELQRAAQRDEGDAGDDELDPKPHRRLVHQDKEAKYEDHDEPNETAARHAPIGRIGGTRRRRKKSCH